eukprot:11564636-Prorocentrum_lima.AAC.1
MFRAPPCSRISEFARTVRNRSGKLGWILQTTRLEREYLTGLKAKAVRKSHDPVRTRDMFRR